MYGDMSLYRHVVAFVALVVALVVALGFGAASAPAASSFDVSGSADANVTATTVGSTVTYAPTDGSQPATLNVSTLQSALENVFSTSVVVDSGGGPITISATLNAAGAADLTVDSHGGGISVQADLTRSAAGGIDLRGGVGGIAFTGTATGVSTVGPQSYDNAVTAASATMTFTATGNIAFGGTLDGAAASTTALV